MKKSDVKKWVKALRSNKYRQARGSLCVEDVFGESYYCCLGVACDLLSDDDWIKQPWSEEWSIGNYEAFDFPEIFDKEKWGATETTSFPTLSHLEEMGLDAAYAQDLAKLNDSGMDFVDIANKIEKDLLNDGP